MHRAAHLAGVVHIETAAGLKGDNKPLSAINTSAEALMSWSLVSLSPVVPIPLPQFATRLQTPLTINTSAKTKTKSLGVSCAAGESIFTRGSGSSQALLKRLQVGVGFVPASWAGPPAWQTHRNVVRFAECRRSR